MDNAAENNEPLIRTEKLTKSYTDGQVTALSDVNLTIRQNEYVAIMGPSGCGKSTLLSMLGALDRPTSGDIYFEGNPLSKMSNLDYFRSQTIGFVFQSFYLLPTLTAIENVQIPMFETNRTAAQRKSKAVELLELVGMSHRSNHLPNQLSIGERQRVAIARALGNDPKVLFADEPTGNLDSKTELDVLDLFADLQKNSDMTLIIVTHSDEVARKAARLIRLRDGQVVDDSA